MVNLTREDIKRAKKALRKMFSPKLDLKPLTYYYDKIFYDHEETKQYLLSMAQTYKVYIYEYDEEGNQILFRLTKNGRLRRHKGKSV